MAELNHVPAHPEVAAALRERLIAKNTATHELQLIFGAFARTAGLPDGVTLEGVEGDAVRVLYPEDATDGG